MDPASPSIRNIGTHERKPFFGWVSVPFPIGDVDCCEVHRRIRVGKMPERTTSSDDQSEVVVDF